MIARPDGAIELLLGIVIGDGRSSSIQDRITENCTMNNNNVEIDSFIGLLSNVMTHMLQIVSDRHGAT